MSEQKIINAFSYLLENNPELSVQNQDSIRLLCQGKNNLDEVVGAIREWCKERGVYDELLELNQTELPTTGDRAILGKKNVAVAEVEQLLLSNVLSSLNRNENKNDEPNQDNDNKQSQTGTKES